MTRLPLTCLLALSLGVAVGACFDEDLTLDLECLSGDDCAPSQVCLKTPYQETIGRDGWCRPDTGCAEGSQPGCACEGGLSCRSPDNNTPLVAVVEACVSMTGTDLETCMANSPTTPTDCFCILPQM